MEKQKMPPIDRPSKTVSIKILANTADEVLAVIRAINRILPGVRITSGIRPSDHTTPSRFPSEFYAFVLVTFELTPGGEARPTQRNAVTAFKEGRRP